MRGKLMVVALLLLAAGTFVASLWFMDINTPVDERFNMRRRPLESDTPGYMILRERAGDYLRTKLEVDTLDREQGSRHGVAEYLVEGKTVRLEVFFVAEGKPTLDQALDGFVERAEGDSRFATIKKYPEARTPYAFGVYSGNTYTYYEFSWINGAWILRASTRDAGQDSLLKFVNGYVY